MATVGFCCIGTVLFAGETPKQLHGLEPPSTAKFQFGVNYSFKIHAYLMFYLVLLVHSLLYISFFPSIFDHLSSYALISFSNEMILILFSHKGLF